MMCLANKRFPCGHCYACRFNKQQEKALRINHELQYHKDNCFITLTYKPELRPYSLVKSDAQKFLKRLRKRLGVDRVRYFLTGEYGDKSFYPHFHMIVFGLAYNDKRVFEHVRYVPSKDIYYCECDAWKKGYVSVGPVTSARIDYVARYCLKKLNGDVADEVYKGRVPEFSLCSRNPGLGYQYALDHEAKLKQDDVCKVLGVKKAIPRYYIDKLYSPSDKIERSHKRDAVITEMFESHRDEFEKYGAMAYSRLVKDKVQMAKEILARRLQRKGKSKCPID